MKKTIWAYGIGALALLLLGVFFSRSGVYAIAGAFRFLGRGPETVYANDARSVNGDEGEIFPGARWLATDGSVIQAHGGQVQRMALPDGRETYIWIGEDKTSGHLGNAAAVYSSGDLLHWENHGDVLIPPESRQQLDTDPYFAALYGALSSEEKDAVFAAYNRGTVNERPKMLHCVATGQYVLWFHSDDSSPDNPSSKYDVGMAGVAVSDSPFGPFRFLGRSRLSQCPPGQLDCYPSSKGEARDMNLFLDSDGTAYVVYTSENNKTLYISKLNESFTALSRDPAEAVCGEDYIRLFPGAMREAPVLIRGENGRYYLMSSSTTGWMSNQARMWSADSIFGRWRSDGNPCVGSGRGVTFDTQSTSLFYTAQGQLIYCGDRWNSEELADSCYIWLPVRLNGERLEIAWEEHWEPMT